MSWQAQFSEGSDAEYVRMPFRHPLAGWMAKMMRSLELNDNEWLNSDDAKWMIHAMMQHHPASILDDPDACDRWTEPEFAWKYADLIRQMAMVAMSHGERWRVDP